MSLGFRVGVLGGVGHRDPSMQIIPRMENHMDKKMEDAMETGIRKGLYRDPDFYQSYLQWALKSTNISYIRLQAI